MHINNSSFVNSNLLYLGFNQDSACFACGMQDGFRIYNTDPLIEKERFEFGDGGIGYVEMLFRCKYLALVGGGQHPKYSPEEVMIWDDVRKVPVAEIHDFNEDVCSVKLRRDRIVVVLARSVRVYTFANPPQLLLTFETGLNQRGLCHLLGTTTCALLAFPAVKVGSVRVVDLANPEGSCLEFSAHTSPLTCLTFNMDGSLLATASEKGTLIRVFSTAHGAKVHELRRGTNPALIYWFNADSSLICAASSNGTVHVFSLKMSKNSTTGFCLIDRAKENEFTDQKILRKILSARASFTRISVPNVNKYHPVPFLCAFGSGSVPLIGPESSSINCLNTDDSIVVICADGSYYKFAFNSKAILFPCYFLICGLLENNIFVSIFARLFFLPFYQGMLWIFRCAKSLASLSHAWPSSSYCCKAIKTSAWFCAEPLKKKRRIDPAIIRARLEKKKRKLEKTIRLILRQGKKLKPIQETTVDNKLLYSLDSLRRSSRIKEEERDERILFLKEWTKYSTEKRSQRYASLRSMMESHEKALKELRLVSEELYEEALKVKPDAIPSHRKGVVSIAPLPMYESPDGDYKDTTKKWD
ncbi:hypothetical protein M514_05615 [Trichuris suis]|uniref:Large ribosomal subunit protein mL40 n=1 Tax=Trichuris suis TaxID=68888 RepID=A0A085NQS4_9BILA|nr:hypothetical protein M513_05615 [Trichuris suis]KFD71820.1 hypothetical protein M514_05615 [Trichuris suis]